MGAAIDLKLLDAKALDLGAVSLKYSRRNEVIVDASEV
jgi:hypothetical protein